MTYRNALVGLLSASTLVLLGACSDDEKATPQVIFDGTLSLGSHSSSECTENGSIFTVGDFGNLNASPAIAAKPVKDGDAEPTTGTRVSVACSVTASGTDTFNVSGTVDLGGSEGGVFTVDGQFKASGDQTNVHAFFSRRFSGNAYEEKDRQCTVQYTTSFQGVAAGRVWGRITCPNVINAAGDRTCAATADFRFENCSQ